MPMGKLASKSEDRVRNAAASGAAGAEAQIGRFADWMHEAALPRWACVAATRAVPFTECLDAAALPVDTGYVRLRVLARQTAVYAQAASRGWSAWIGAARAGWEFMAERCWSEDEGWASRVSSAGRVIERRFDLYDQAFALYACAHWARASGAELPLVLAGKTMALIDARLSNGGLGGWTSDRTRAGCDQNSHMHYLEALLALQECMPGAPVADRIERILALAGERLFDPLSGTISEFFRCDWQPATPVPCVEPGHQFEWYWLLEQARDLGFTPPEIGGRLLAFAEAAGIDAATGLVVNGCAPDGRITDGQFRLWPQCEAVRAWSLLPGPERRGRIAHVLERLFATFLNHARRGLWHERLGSAGQALPGPVPATTLYHLWGACEALQEAPRARGRVDAPC